MIPVSSKPIFQKPIHVIFPFSIFKTKCSTSKCSEAVFRSKICLQNKTGMARGVPFGQHSVKPLLAEALILPTKRPCSFSRCTQPFIPGSGKESLNYRPRTNLSDLSVWKTRPSNKDPMNGDISSINSRTCCCTCHCAAAKSCPQVYNMIPWFGVFMWCISFSIYVVNILHHNPYRHYPLSPSWYWSSFWFTTKHQKRV